MNKRIGKSMRLLVWACIVLMTLLFCISFYFLSFSQLKKQVQNAANKIAVQTEKLAPELREAYYETIGVASSLRFTVIDAQGEVLYDNQAVSEQMDNHAGRKEVQGAIEKGQGESKRRSNTLNSETYYFAMKLQNGQVIRIAADLKSMFGVIKSAWPIVLFGLITIFLFERGLAKRLTNQIIKPFNQMDSTQDFSIEYEELTPFVKTISDQKTIIKKQIADLQDRSDLIVRILENISEGFLLLDQDKNIILANQSAKECLDLKHINTPQPMIEVLRDTYFMQNLDFAVRGEKRTMLLSRCKNTYKIHFNPSENSGAMVIMMDVSEKEKAEQMRQEFSANVSHELKTPLTSILGYAEMIENDMVCVDDIPAFASKIKEQSGRLLGMIEDIMLLSRLDEGLNDLFVEEVNLYTTAKQVVEELYDKATTQKIVLSLSGESKVIRGNARLLYEMLFNLVDNAIKYNTLGGEVNVFTSVEDKRAVITIQDTGVGIAKQEQGRVFERFYRTDRSRSQKTGGTGLGLSIVKHIVQFHGGTLMLESEEDKGTKITIRF